MAALQSVSAKYEAIKWFVSVGISEHRNSFITTLDTKQRKFGLSFSQVNQLLLHFLEKWILIAIAVMKLVAAMEAAMEKEQTKLIRKHRAINVVKILKTLIVIIVRSSIHAAVFCTGTVDTNIHVIPSKIKGQFLLKPELF